MSGSISYVIASSLTSLTMTTRVTMNNPPIKPPPAKAWRAGTQGLVVGSHPPSIYPSPRLVSNPAAKYLTSVSGKTKIRHVAQPKFFLIALTLTLLLNIPGAIATPDPTTASPDGVKWSQVSVPAEGETGNWVLASGSDVQHQSHHHPHFP